MLSDLTIELKYYQALIYLVLYALEIKSYIILTYRLISACRT